MSILTEIARLSGNVQSALTAIGEKGVAVPGDATSDDLAALIASITTGGGSEGTTWGDGGLTLPDYVHRLEFFQLTLTEATTDIITPYDMTAGHNANVPNIVIAWTNDTVSANEIIDAFAYYSVLDSQGRMVYVYAQDYGNHLAKSTIYPAGNTLSTGTCVLQVKTLTDLLNSANKPTLSFATNVTYNFIIGRIKNSPTG